MCGISIAINKKNGPVEAETMQRMNDRILHRGPDDGGFYFGNTCALGHRRLSILDLSSAGHQPMQMDALRITFNGEIYNYIELREELRALGHSFSTATDTEVLLAAYREWGTDSFAKLNGMWAFAIFDEARNELICCRDHFGIKPLYYYDSPELFLAASEIKQMTALEAFKPEIEHSVVANFLETGRLNYSASTFFKNVKELPGGWYLRYALGSNEFDTVQWYDLRRQVSPVKDDFETACNKVGALFAESVRIRMRSDVAVGSCLSGGLDSSAIAATVAGNDPATAGSFSTVTAYYDDPLFDEREYSDHIVSTFGFKPVYVFPKVEEFWRDDCMRRIVYAFDQPYSGASNYNQYKVFEAARNNGLIVMLDGQGSDEYFCGYGEFLDIKTKALLKDRKYLGYARHVLSNKNGLTGYKMLLSELLGAFRPKASAQASPGYLNKEYKAAVLTPETYDDLRELSYEELGRFPLNSLLHSEDRNSMQFSIESRLPFLDHRLVEYVLSLDDAHKISPKGVRKHLLRESVPSLPDKVRRRKDKFGFNSPDQRYLLSNPGYVREKIAQLVAQTDYFDPSILNAFDRFAAGEGPYHAQFFRAATLALFLELNAFTNLPANTRRAS